MKKIFALVLALAMVCGLFAGCTKTSSSTTDTTTTVATTPAGEDSTTAADSDDVAKDYASFIAAEVDSKVELVTFVQAKQSYYAEKTCASIYTQNADGAIFLYNASCTQEVYDALVPGTAIKVTGFKAIFEGEIEVAEGATIEILEQDKYIAEITDVTDLLGTDDLIKNQNKFVAFKNATVTKAATYKWDGSGVQGDDLYFNVKINDNEYTFTVESYLCNKDTEVYQAVEALAVDTKIDLEGFLYWYQGPNPHITKVTVIE